MEIVPSNSENGDQRHRVSRRKRKYISLNERKLSSSSSNKAISLINSKSSNSHSAAGAGYLLLEAPPRAIGVDGHFYECMKCKEVGSLICCDTCACTYHYECLDPPLESVPEGDWFCQNCTEEADDLSDSTVNLKRRRRSMKRACKVSSGCSLCSNINKKLIPDENDFFSFKTNSAPQPNSSNRGKPSARNDDTQQNTNNGDTRLVLRLGKRAEGCQIETKQTGKRASSSAQAEKDQNTSTTVNLHPRRRGRRTMKRTRKLPSTVAHPQQNEQQQIQDSGLAMVLYGEKPRPEDIAAMIAAEEALRGPKVKEIPWSDVELDALWVGVRRYGPDNWDTILEDPNLRILVLCKKTSPDLSTRWQKELEKMYSILQISGFLPSAPPNGEPADQIIPEPEVAEISNGGATAQQLLLQAVQIRVTSTESGPLAPNPQGSNGEQGGEPKESTNQQRLAPPESGPSAPNHHQGTSCSSSLRDSPSVPKACDIAVISNEGAGGGDQANTTTQQLVAVASPELSGALVVHNNQQGSSSSSSLGATVSISRACVPVAATPPQWRPNLNLHPMANHILFQAFQQRANPETQMMNRMGRVVSFPTTTPAGPGRSVAMAAPRPPANSTVRPNLFLGGFIPVRHAHGGPKHPVRNRY